MQLFHGSLINYVDIRFKAISVLSFRTRLSSATTTPTTCYWHAPVTLAEATSSACWRRTLVQTEVSTRVMAFPVSTVTSVVARRLDWATQN